MSSGNPFEGMPFFGDLLKLLGQQGPISWDGARQLALSIATNGESEPNVDPLERIKFEQLARVADLQIANATGLDTSATGRVVNVVPVTRTQWALDALDAWRPLFEALAGAIGPASPGAAPGGAGSPLDPSALDHPSTGLDDELAADAWMAQLMGLLSPMMLGMTAGSLVGHLAVRSFGQYDLPLPRPATDELPVLVGNLDTFGEEWSLPADDLRLWVCLHEVAHHAVLNVPHVRARLDELLLGYASAFQTDPNALEHRMSDLDPTNMENVAGLQELFADPEVLLGAVRSDRQRELLPQLDAFVVAIAGYVDHVMDRIGHGLIGSYGMVTEAMRRRRVEASSSDRFVERLFGLELSQERYDRGEAFAEGVVERAGEEGLARLWASPRELPTPAELEAPGLWLARIDLAD